MYQALIGADGDPSHPSVLGQAQSVFTQMGAAINAIESQTTNQTALTQQVTSEYQQLAGVSLDEETINLMQSERVYQASAKVLSTMDSVLDTLINRMGA